MKISLNFPNGMLSIQMSEFLKFIITVLISSGIASSLVFLIKKRIAVEIEASIKNKYDSKIENLKSELSTSQLILANSLTNQTEGIRVTHEKKLKAIELYWKEILKFEEFMQPLSQIDLLMNAKEIERIKNKIDSSKIFQKIFKEWQSEQRLTTITVSGMEIEELRPYIGEELWELRYFYFFFLRRILYLYRNKNNKDLNLKHWMRDEIIKNNIFKKKLLDEEIEFIYEIEHEGIYREISIFKQKILKEISEITSGVSVGKSSLESARLLSKKN